MLLFVFIAGAISKLNQKNEDNDPSRTPLPTALHHPSLSTILIVDIGGFFAITAVVLFLCFKKMPETERLPESSYLTIE